MLRVLILLSMFLNSCVAIAQEDLEFIDFTQAREMPEFDLIEMKSGERYKSELHKDAAYVLEFYFAACPACNQNAGNVKRLQRAFSGKPKVQIVEISIDCENDAYATWIERHAPLGPVLNGCDASIVEKLGVERFPTTYVFAPSRREAMRGVGVWSSSTYNRIKDYLEQVR